MPELALKLLMRSAPALKLSELRIVRISKYSEP
jgi:hypothetical protein